MRWALGMALGLCLATPVRAEQVLVSVAQLAEATRLVLTFETRPDWSTEASGRTLDLAFASDGHVFDIESGNAFVAGSRIARMSAADAGDALSLELACACRADVYPFGSGSIVVEVRDAIRLAEVGDVTTAAPSQPELPAIPTAALQPPPSFEPIATPPPPRPLAAAVLPSEALPNLSDIPLGESGTALELLETLGFSLPSAEESQAVALLGRELSRAAAQGLVEPDAVPSDRAAKAGDAAPEAGLNGRANLSVITSMDRDIEALRDHLPPTHQGSACFSDSDLDVASWGDTTDFSTLGRLRKEALAENGDILPEGAKAIARYYIALGFGSEAAYVATHMAEGEQKRLIEALAEIVDHGASGSTILDGQIHCDGKVALWAALARPIAPDATPASTDKILSTFSALPPHHRAHLGPVLAERLRSIGLESAARNAVNAVARGGLQSNESELVTARLELGGTRPDLARETLVDISNGTDVAAAEALLELLKDAERREMAPNPDWVEDAPSLARATEGTEVAAPLNIAGLRGRIALGDFDALRLALAEDTPGLNTETRDALSVAALIRAASVADDTVFLRAEVGLSKLLTIDDMPRAGRFAVAGRLLAVGLASRAERYLPADPASQDEIDIVADVFVQTGQADRAIALLSEHAEAEAARKLGEVLSRTGRNEPAIQAFEQSGALDEAARAAMRAGDWNWIAEREVDGTSGTLSETARVLLAPPAEPIDPDDPGNGLLVKSSRELRRRAADLLSETRLSDGSLPFTN